MSEIPDDQQNENDEEGGQKRQRGTINFPYVDLDDAVLVAKAVFKKGGQSASLDQIAAELDHKNIRSGGFRSKVNAARLFGLLKTSAMNVRLEPLGLQVVDPKTEAQAREQAFLRVPVFRAIFQKYRGNLLPTGDALETELANQGVAPGQKDRARQVFLRSAAQAGYFQSGSDRLIPPGFAQADKVETPKDVPDDRVDGGSKKTLRDHPLIQGLFEMLPEQAPWSDEGLDEWLAAAKVNFKLVYAQKSAATTVPSGPEQPSERSESDAPGSETQT